MQRSFKECLILIFYGSEFLKRQIRALFKKIWREKNVMIHIARLMANAIFSGKQTRLYCAFKILSNVTKCLLKRQNVINLLCNKRPYNTHVSFFYSYRKWYILLSAHISFIFFYLTLEQKSYKYHSSRDSKSFTLTTHWFNTIGKMQANYQDFSLHFLSFLTTI